MLKIPDNYLVLDVETNGLGKDVGDVHIVQIGWCAVVDREIHHNGSVVLSLPDSVPLAQRAIDVHGLDRARIKERGKDPTETLTAVRDLARGYDVMVGHNIVAFDAEIIDHNFNRYGIEPVGFQSNIPVILDTGIIYKAKQIGEWKSQQESFWDFTKRVQRIRVRVKWKLDVCLEAFGINDPRDKHDAGEDCYLTHKVLEAMREKGWMEDVLMQTGGAAGLQRHWERTRGRGRDPVRPAHKGRDS